jgi:hypothetical protein
MWFAAQLQQQVSARPLTRLDTLIITQRWVFANIDLHRYNPP